MIFRCVSLLELSLAYFEEGIFLVANLQSVEVLHLDYCYGIDSGFWSQFPALAEIYLYDAHFVDFDGILALPALRKISISGSSNVALRQLRSLRELRSLQSLELTGFGIDDEQAQQLQQEFNSDKKEVVVVHLSLSQLIEQNLDL